MNRKAEGAATAKHTLSVSSRQVLGGEGVTLEFGVACPRRGHYAPLSACFACDACEGVVVGESEADNVVLCSPAEEDTSLVAGAVPLTGAANDVTVSAIMTPHVLCVRDDLPTEALGPLLDEKRIGSVPVVDRLARPIGIASIRDALRRFTTAPAASRRSTVADVMTPIPYALPANETVAKAAAVMAFERLHALPVVAPSGQVIGIVSSHDVMAWLARISGYVVETRE